MMHMKEAPARPEPQAVFYVVRDGRVAVARCPRSQFGEMLRLLFCRPQPPRQ